MTDWAGNIFRVPELKKRIIFTALALIAYRLGSHIPTPGIDAHALLSFFQQAGGTLLGFFDLFSGGALRRLSILALGIMPYISASIILQLLAVVFPPLEKLSKEGEAGRKKISQYTRYGTVLLAAIQAMGIAIGLENMRSPTGEQIVIDPGMGFRMMTTITLTTGSIILMWLGEQITERGIGNGISLLIFAGIIVRVPEAIVNTWRLLTTGELQVLVLLIVLVMMVLVVAGVIVMTLGQRPIVVQYAKRIVGRRVYGGQSTHIPLRINTAGVIPVIFASSIIVFPATIAQFINHPWMQGVAGALSPGTVTYTVLYAVAIIFFTYFYTAIVFNPTDVADNMRKHGGFIPGIRPGTKTAEFIEKVLDRITLVGAIYLTLISILPELLISSMNVPFFFGGTSLLIVVGVALDTVQQVESHLLMRNYEGFLKKGQVKGRLG
ncbi:preprotein translocase subunit SecY [Candidatus Methylomirabilis limnetica]|uniref:Protein translocase subunit SecY n=1 Tax=Candidatus Methylomirabilis limnetica TaxID=2033718 RepID=A0A2T4TX53_9BACT|nr:preprotein translocase subunit SecY [Candidatus Methylomirabilis limnetica]PTL35693.1 preprotein translocase subunit SecY [Candidatus Methylomirabilis limnetica]